jgi:hypothetical protein
MRVVISLRGTPVDTRVAGDFNQLRSPAPGSSGTIHARAIVQYAGTGRLAVRGGFNIWPDGYAVKVDIDARGGIHIFTPPDFQPRVVAPLPHDRPVASMNVYADLPARIERELELI